MNQPALPHPIETILAARARQHVDAMTAHRFRFLQERVKQRYGRTLDPQAAAMVAAVDRYRQKHGKWT
jgi:hypothetical protein